MATQLKLRQGNEKENSLYIGALGELTYDTEQRELHVHDGTNPGGNVCLKKSSTDLDAKQDLDSSININNITNCITYIPQDIRMELTKETEVILYAWTIEDQSMTVYSDTLTPKNGPAYDSHGKVVDETYGAYFETIDSVLYINYYNGISTTNTPAIRKAKADIKGNTLTVKAGTKTYFPNGLQEDGATKKIDPVTLESDCTRTLTISSGNFDGDFLIFYRPDVNKITSIILENTGSGNELPTDLSWNTWVFYNTSTNKILFTEDSGESWTREYSLPLGICTVKDSKFTEIKQIFNGYGFIGSELFALPGLTCALPNGLQNNGEMKNIYRTVANVDMWHENGNTYTSLGIRNINDNAQISRCGNGFTSAQQLPELEDAPIYCAFYLSPENAFYRKENSTAYSKQDWCQIGDYTADSANNYRITSLIGKHVFQALDYNDTSLMSQAHMPSNKYVDVSLGSSGTTYTVKNNGYFFIRTVANQGDGWITMCTNNDTAFGQTTRFVSGNDVRMLIPVQSGTFIQLYYSNLGNGTGGQANMFRFIYTQGVE
jgi:hypothetical protein